VLCWPFASKKLRKTNHQHWGFIRPPGVPLGEFQLKMNHVWFCKVLMLFSFVSEDDTGSKHQVCAYVSVSDEYKVRRHPGGITYINHVKCIICMICIICIIDIFSSGWLDQANGTMLYERRQNKQVLYVIPISPILGKLPLVPVGDTGTIPFSMRDELHEVDGASDCFLRL